MTEILLRPVTGFPPTVFGAGRDFPSRKFRVLTAHCVDKIGDVVDGNGVVAAAVNVDATLLPGQTRRIPRERPHGGGGMQSPASGTSTWRRGHQISAESRATKVETISVNERNDGRGNATLVG